jgi:radical SAM superfamily enzyme YgiQ (UPF0313 family)
MSAQSKILLVSINAGYIHSAFGLRYLYANMGELQLSTEIQEHTIRLRAIDIVEKILAYQPAIIGFGIYIWNIEHTTQVISLIKTIAPEITIIIGGPEVSFEYQELAVFKLCDYLIPGAADTGFAKLCRQLISSDLAPEKKVFQHQEPPIAQLRLPYDYYTDEDISNRVIYVEASRGCPFKCEFCLSALDKTAISFDLDSFLLAMAKLYKRGARRFKFVDRTFNLKIESSLRIMNFFLDRIDPQLFLHFEIIPDRLPEALKSTIQKFPKGSLQFEIGVQSFNPAVQKLISRKQDNNKTIDNLRWLKTQTNAHLHADLIFGLPGEDLLSFAKGFNQLYALGPHDVQLGILKRLRGTPVIRHSEAYQMKYEPAAPYSVLSNDRVSFNLLQRIKRFARYWELIANSGRFQQTLVLLLSSNAFERFLVFSDWLYQFSGKTHRIALRQLFDYLYHGYVDCFENDASWLIEFDRQTFIKALLDDYSRAGLKGIPEFYKKMDDFL